MVEPEVYRNSRVAKVRVSGPLLPFVSAFKARLAGAGYTPLSSVNQQRLLAHLSRWLEARQLGVADLTDERIEEFFAQRRSSGCTWMLTRRSLAPLLDCLREQQVLPAPARPGPTSAVEVLLASFQRYLLQERGLAPSTTRAHVVRARRFLQAHAADGELGKLTAYDVTRAVLDEAATLSVGSAQYFVVALRSFLRFCHLQGLIESDLASATLSVTGRRRSPLPGGISQSGTQALLRSCDRQQAAGSRDYAVLVTLVRLGLRAAPPVRGGRDRDRSVARPRADLHHRDLPARRHVPEGARNRSHPAGRGEARALSGPGRHPRLPRKPVIMPTSTGCPPVRAGPFLRRRRHNHHVGIIHEGGAGNSG